MPKIILGLVGPIASGKDASKKFLEERFHAKSFRFSTVMRDILDRLGLEHNRLNLSHLSSLLRAEFGEDLFAKTMARDVTADPSEFIIVDGIRRLADIAYLKDVPGFRLMSIDADPKLRHARLNKRGENADDNQKSFDQFLADHQLETELSIPEVMERADYKVRNDGTLEDLHAQLEKIISEIKQ